MLGTILDSAYKLSRYQVILSFCRWGNLNRRLILSMVTVLVNESSDSTSDLRIFSFFFWHFVYYFKAPRGFDSVLFLIFFLMIKVTRIMRRKERYWGHSIMMLFRPGWEKAWYLKQFNSLVSVIADSISFVPWHAEKIQISSSSRIRQFLCGLLTFLSLLYLRC